MFISTTLNKDIFSVLVVENKKTTECYGTLKSVDDNKTKQAIRQIALDTFAAGEYISVSYDTTK